MVLDGHSDLLYDVTRRRLAGERLVLERHHLDRLRRGGVEGLVLALWTTAAEETFWKDVPGMESAAVRTAVMMRCTRAEVVESPWLAAVRTAAGAEQAREQGQIYAFFAIEGMAAIGEDLTGINRYADFGARIGMLTWNETNALATGAGGDRYSPLTDLGRQAVTRMQNLGMLPDVSHLNDGGFADVIRLARGPVIASHSNCRALCDVRRNLTDDQLRAIRDTGGVVGVNVYHGFVHADPEQQTAEMLARHAAHMADVMGVEHVACGFPASIGVIAPSVLAGEGSGGRCQQRWRERRCRLRSTAGGIQGILLRAATVPPPGPRGKVPLRDSQNADASRSSL